MAVFGPTVFEMKKIGKVAKMILVAMPTLSGSIPRIFFGKNIAQTGGKKWA